MSFSDAEIAAMDDHEAVPRGLPRRIEAWLSVRTEGRIDDPDFAIELTVEPMKYAHPWISYQRHGALLQVGEQMWRLTPQQLQVFMAVDEVLAAGDSIEARLRVWPALVEALYATDRGRVRISGQLPRVHVRQVRDFPAQSLTREAGKLCKASSKARWAMTKGYRYYVKAA